MPRYMARSIRNEAGASALLSQGFATRVEQIRELTAQWGGTLENVYYSNSGEMVVIANYEDPQNNALVVLQAMASGAFISGDIQEIYTGEEMDAALAQQPVPYRPPGS
jgi:uncharacterized protein with GYD domain